MTLLQMGLSASVLILCTLALRVLAVHRLPKVLFLALWELAALRLLLPVYIPMPFSPPWLSLPSLAGGTSSVQELHTQMSLPPFVPVWAAVTLLLAVHFLLAYRRNMRTFKASLPDQTAAIQSWLVEHPCLRPLEVRISDQITSPLTYGILHPVILLPKGLDWTDSETLQAVLIHEYVHVRRWDNLAKIIFAGALCLHWWNPLVWVLYMAANRDIELSCDAAVLRVLGRDRRSAYALALIALEEDQVGCAPAQSYFSQNTITERIEAIMKFKKSSVAAIAASALLVVSCAAVAFATEQEPSAPMEGSYIALDGYSKITLEDGSTIYFPAGHEDEDAEVSFRVTADGKDAVTVEGQEIQKADFSRVVDLTSLEELN